MYSISKEFQFCSAHHLLGLPSTHPCATNHGHNYRVEFHFRDRTLSDVGFVIDYRALESIKKYIDETIDHKDLNTVFPFNPTSEKMCKFFYDKFRAEFKELWKVRLSETDKTWSEFVEDSNV